MNKIAIKLSKIHLREISWCVSPGGDSHDGFREPDKRMRAETCCIRSWRYDFSMSGLSNWEEQKEHSYVGGTKGIKLLVGLHATCRNGYLSMQGTHTHLQYIRLLHLAVYMLHGM